MFGISEQKYVEVDQDWRSKKDLREILRTCFQKILKNLGERFSESGLTVAHFIFIYITASFRVDQPAVIVLIEHSWAGVPLWRSTTLFS